MCKHIKSGYMIALYGLFEDLFLKNLRQMCDRGDK